MRLVIGTTAPNTHTPNSYEIEIKTMMGDADAYESFKVGPFTKDEDEPLLENLLELLARIDDNSISTRKYDEVEGFLPWFSSSSIPTEEEFANWYPSYPSSYEIFLEIATKVDTLYEKTDYPDWPYHEDYEAHNRFDGYVIRYYDDNRVEHRVTVEN